MTIGRGSFLSELVERAGGENLFADVTTSSAPVSIEAVSARDPDLIFTTVAGPASFATRPEWRVVRAVRERRFLSRVRLRVQPAGPAVATGHPQLSPRGCVRRQPVRRRHRSRRAGAGRRVSLLLGLTAGAVPLSLAEVWDGLGAGADASASVIVRELRVPRVLLAFLVGGSLADLRSGAPGHDPQSARGALPARPLERSGARRRDRARVAARRDRGRSRWPPFVGALAAVGLVYRLSLVAGRRLDPRVLLLSGVVVGSFAGALMSAIIVLSDAPTVRNAFLWLLGGFGAASWRALAVFAVYAAVPLAADPASAPGRSI